MSGKELERTDTRRGDGTLIMEDARIVFRNFAGAEGMYNREGDRNFCVLLEDDLAEDMKRDGWNVKRLKPRDDAEQGTAYIQVSVGFKGRPPRMVMISSKGRVDLCQPGADGRPREEEAVLLDWADINKVDLIIRPYHWNVNGNTGVKAYLKSIFVVINEDYLELKYADVPRVELESAAKPIQIEAGDGLPELEDSNIIDAEIVEDME